jgi:selenocysteine-specific translation elongation factor
MAEQPPGAIIGVFGSEPEARTKFMNSVAKKSEVEGITVYHRARSNFRYTFVDDLEYPPRIQGCARIASISTFAYYIFPVSGRLSTADGEVAVLLDAYEIPGKVLLIDSNVDRSTAIAQLKGTRLYNYESEMRSGLDSNIELPQNIDASRFPSNGTLLYIDRAFTVKGVGTVVLGFLLSGKISMHDVLVPLPGPTDRTIEVKGIQVNDVDFDSVGPGIRVGLSIKGVEPDELRKTAWLASDDIQTTSSMTVEVNQSRFYRDEWRERAVHMQLPGEMVPVKVGQKVGDGRYEMQTQSRVPVWGSIKLCLLDLNAKGLRVIGSCRVRF